MTSKRKVMTVLAVLIVLSLVVPSTALAVPNGKAHGIVTRYKATQPWKAWYFKFDVKELSNYPFAQGSAYSMRPSNGRWWSIPKVSCVKIANNNSAKKAYFGGKGKGTHRGKYVMVAVKDGGAGHKDKVWVKTTRSKSFFESWCRHPTVWPPNYKWNVSWGNLKVNP